jgi:hypothetical protein
MPDRLGRIRDQDPDSVHASNRIGYSSIPTSVSHLLTVPDSPERMSARVLSNGIAVPVLAPIAAAIEAVGRDPFDRPLNLPTDAVRAPERNDHQGGPVQPSDDLVNLLDVRCAIRRSPEGANRSGGTANDAVSRGPARP